jgi:hypothetical protein
MGFFHKCYPANISSLDLDESDQAVTSLTALHSLTSNFERAASSIASPSPGMFSSSSM